MKVFSRDIFPYGNITWENGKTPPEKDARDIFPYPPLSTRRVEGIWENVCLSGGRGFPKPAFF